MERRLALTTGGGALSLPHHRFLARGEFGDVSEVLNRRVLIAAGGGGGGGGGPGGGGGGRSKALKTVRLLGRTDAERVDEQSPLLDEVCARRRLGSDRHRTKRWPGGSIAPALVHWPSPGKKIVARHVGAKFGFVDWAFF